jgi:hypothetical protein
MGALFGNRQSSGRVAGRVYHYVEPPSDKALGEYWESNLDVWASQWGSYSASDKALGELLWK